MIWLGGSAAILQISIGLNTAPPTTSPTSAKNRVKNESLDPGASWSDHSSTKQSIRSVVIGCKATVTAKQGTCQTVSSTHCLFDFTIRKQLAQDVPSASGRRVAYEACSWRAGWRAYFLVCYSCFSFFKTSLNLLII